MEFQTDRLHIRILQESDWPELQKIWIDFYQSKYAIYDAPLPTDDKGAKALIDHLAKESPEAQFTAGTALENTPSCNLLKKLGFTCISTETMSFDGRFFFQGGNFVRMLK